MCVRAARRRTLACFCLAHQHIHDMLAKTNHAAKAGRSHASFVDEGYYLLGWAVV